MKLLLPLALGLIGLVGGAGAGWYLKPPPPPAPCLDAHGAEQDPSLCAEAEPTDAELGEAAAPTENPKDASEFVKLDRQFIVPLVSEEKISSLVVLALAVEVAPGHVEDVMTREPRVRDALLRALFEHAYTGGFNGDFTAEYVLRDLRRNLLIAARKVSGEAVRNVLISDIIRQDQ